MRRSALPAPPPKPARKPTLSPTRIQTFLDCAVKYRYIYLDKIGRFYQRARPGFSFGSTLHHVLQEFHDNGAADSPERMAARLEQDWIGAGYENSEQEIAHRQDGERIVQAYHDAHKERIAARVETVATEKTINCDMGRFNLSGRVDRIDRHADGHLEIIDYKSGRWAITEEEAESSLALSCYQLILGRLHPDSEVVGTLYSLRSGRQASYGLSGDALKQFETDILNLGNLILDTNFLDQRPTRMEACDTCDFLSRCKRYWQQEERRSRLDPPHDDDGFPD